VANEVYAQDLLNLMVVHMDKFEFEVGHPFSRRLARPDQMDRRGRIRVISTTPSCGDRSGRDRPPSSTSRIGPTSSLPPLRRKCRFFSPCCRFYSDGSKVYKCGHCLEHGYDFERDAAVRATSEDIAVFGPVRLAPARQLSTAERRALLTAIDSSRFLSISRTRLSASPATPLRT
jgi:hypothetical protein